jgi:hypothetical protein
VLADSDQLVSDRDDPAGQAAPARQAEAGALAGDSE